MKIRDGRKWVDEGGDELHRWGSWEPIEKQSEEEEIAELMAAMNPPFWSDMEKIQSECDTILAENGFPRSADHIIYVTEESWWLSSDTTKPSFQELLKAGKGANSARGYAFAKKRTEPLSDPWFAALIGGMIYMISLRKDSWNETQLDRVFQIGVALEKWRMRHYFKPAILTGKKQRKTLDAYRVKAIAEKRTVVSQRREAIAEILPTTRLQGGALEKYLLRKLETEFGIRASDRTVRRDLVFLREASHKVGQTG